MIEDEKPKNYINSIIRATRILELFGRLDVQYLGIAEICKELDLQKTVVFNIVKTLVYQGWLVQDTPNGKYRLGTRILSVSSVVTKGISTEDLFVEEMAQLRDKYNEEVVLTEMIDGLPICVERTQSNNRMQIYSRVGRVTSLFLGSTGKCLFAYQTPEFIDEKIRERFPSTLSGEAKREEVYRELEKIRRQGFCTSASELDPGVASVAVPILNAAGIGEYSLALCGEENRMKRENMEQMRMDLLAAAERIMSEMKML